MNLPLAGVLGAAAALAAVNGFYWSAWAPTVADVIKPQNARGLDLLRSQHAAVTPWIKKTAFITLLHVVFTLPLLVAGVEAVTTIGRSGTLDLSRSSAAALGLVAALWAVKLGSEVRSTVRRQRALEVSIGEAESRSLIP